jgi:hypothetical protein
MPFRPVLKLDERKERCGHLLYRRFVHNLQGTVNMLSPVVVRHWMSNAARTPHLAYAVVEEL